MKIIEIREKLLDDALACVTLSVYTPSCLYSHCKKTDLVCLILTMEGANETRFLCREHFQAFVEYSRSMGENLNFLNLRRDPPITRSVCLA